MDTIGSTKSPTRTPLSSFKILQNYLKKLGDLQVLRLEKQQAKGVSVDGVLDAYANHRKEIEVLFLQRYVFMFVRLRFDCVCAGLRRPRRGCQVYRQGVEEPLQPKMSHPLSSALTPTSQS